MELLVNVDTVSWWPFKLPCGHVCDTFLNTLWATTGCDTAGEECLFNCPVCSASYAIKLVTGATIVIIRTAEMNGGMLYARDEMTQVSLAHGQCDSQCILELLGGSSNHKLGCAHLSGALQDYVAWFLPSLAVLEPNELANHVLGDHLDDQILCGPVFVCRRSVNDGATC